MVENTIYILFSLLRSVFHGNQMSDADKQLVTEDSLKDIVKLASKHDIAHLVALGLLNNDVAKNEKTKTQLKQITFRAVYRYEKLNYELKQVCEALEKAEIVFFSLKGSVIRKYYPEPWMRTSCDIDILVHEKDLRTAISYLVKNLGHTEIEQNTHDVSLFSSSGVHLELHYDLVEDEWANLSNSVLQNVWNHTSPKKGYQYWLEMSDEMFYFYHIAHMAKHIEFGGCGIRPFIDLWILDHIDGIDQTKRDNLLKQGNLLKFAEVARKLSKIWFADADADSISQQMEDYILRGGVYGTNENRIIVQQLKKGGKIRYALSKIFIPYEIIQYSYPILQKHRWLTPIMQVRRWFRLIFCGHAKRSIRELKYNSRVSHEDASNMQNFLKSIGL